MAKVAFSKLGLKEKKEVKTITINNVQIEVKQYLPINNKIDIITNVINNTQDQNNFPNPVKIEVLATLELIFAYTNLSFTEKQKEDVAKLYDLLDSNDIINEIIEAIPEEEYRFLIESLDDTIDAVYSYRNSVLGILEQVSKDYSQLDLDTTNMQKAISDPDNLALLKEILTKMG